MLLKRIAFVLLAAALLAISATMSFAEQSPQDRVKEGADKLIKILSETDIDDPAHHDAKIAELRSVAEQYIDFRLVTMYSVGKPWLKMDTAMQDNLVEAFIQLLERTYLKRIPAYEGQGVEYKKEMVKGNKAKVVTEIIDKDTKIVVEFRLKMVHQQWMIYDVVAEGVSLVANYRSQFSQVLADGSPEELLKLIQERVKKLDEVDQGDTATNS